MRHALGLPLWKNKHHFRLLTQSHRLLQGVQTLRPDYPTGTTPVLARSFYGDSGEPRRAPFAILCSPSRVLEVPPVPSPRAGQSIQSATARASGGRALLRHSSRPQLPIASFIRASLARRPHAKLCRVLNLRRCARQPRTFPPFAIRVSRHTRNPFTHTVAPITFTLYLAHLAVYLEAPPHRPVSANHSVRVSCCAWPAGVRPVPNTNTQWPVSQQQPNRSPRL
ncbi:hypothetical protein C2E23DRAFT_354739 [Lenzites betulinus]|nr:hypothetical protein C2E23DRAFT_354739 [Lenzites betulinus]